MVVNEKGLKALGVKPLARIHHMTVIGGDPVIMLEAPLPATHRALQKAGMKIDDIDLYEVNEAFASVPTAWLKDVGADPDKLNVNGGAIALGHPLGGSGAKLMSTLVNALHAQGQALRPADHVRRRRAGQRDHCGTIVGSDLYCHPGRGPSSKQSLLARTSSVSLPG